MRRGALVALLLGATACAPAAHQLTSAHPASSQAPVGPRVVLPASEEAEAAAPDAGAPPDAHDHHDHHQHHKHHDPSAPGRNEAPAAPSPKQEPPSPQPHQHTP